MSDIINQYELLAPFQSKNAGFSRWTFAERDGGSYFLKEYIDPIYPTGDALSYELTSRRVADCEKYEAKKRMLYEAINDASDGNLVRIEEFFRYDSHYYISTKRVDEDSIDIEKIAALPFRDKLLLCKSIAHSIMGLHKAGIVHADLKKTNIILKKTQKGKLVGKIIDIDCSFFENDPPESEDELGGDQVYLAPESCLFICGEDVQLSSKIDIFALGVLFHQYMTGELPDFDRNEYDYVFEAVLDEQTVGISNVLPDQMKKMLLSTLEADPERRPSAEELYIMLDSLDPEYSHRKDMPEVKIESKEKKTPENLGAGDWFSVAGDL